ncbi:TMEM175 family protein [Tahibacter soli]|uniref:TMEM175 family protein n=1 Tax=Tahibacter soli TaxID=2983605 RepID=A0A9X3YK65_9GAMM|nr:TMEM175 family protein [Tahibacter soli]MDC8012710.1 TMEM175 family protein [Tahibacter soli]
MHPKPLATARVRDDGFADRGAEVTRFESFLDASFAFTITLLVIAGSEVPDSIAKLVNALKSLPTFAASFLLIALFWAGHDTWSRRYGLDDRRSRALGFLLIFLMLVYVYPLKMLFGSFFAWISAGALPAKFPINGVAELRAMFYTYAIAFGTLGGTMALLYWHAWRQRDALALSAHEREVTRGEIVRWALAPAFALLSAALAWSLSDRPADWQTGLPGLVYFLLHGATTYLRRRQRVKLAAVAA